MHAVYSNALNVIEQLEEISYNNGTCIFISK